MSWNDIADVPKKGIVMLLASDWTAPDGEQQEGAFPAKWNGRAKRWESAAAEGEVHTTKNPEAWASAD